MKLGRCAPLVFGGCLWAISGHTGYRVEFVAPVSLGTLEQSGQVADPRLTPDEGHLGFELLRADGESLEVFVASVRRADAGIELNSPPEPVMPEPPPDPFQLGGASRPVSEHLSWGPPKRGQPRVVVAATRRAASRGAAQINFDLHLSEPGRKRFLTRHEATDAQPAFSPDGESIAFASGRTGQGDLYLYHFFAREEPVVRITFDPAGAELYPTWDLAGARLAYTGHLAGQDHIHVIDDVRSLVLEAEEGRRRSLARQRTRDLTPGWKASCLAPSFSPDGRWVAFYVRDGEGLRADLYVVPAEGGERRLLLHGGLPETHGGPRWSPSGDGLFAVRDDADRMNPLVWVPLDPGAADQELPTGTDLNADPFVLPDGDGVLLLFTAQGSADGTQKRWRRIHVARLGREVSE